LVENAIIHGLEPKEQGGFISITIKRRQDFVRAVVEDDGIGFKPSAAAERDDKIGLNSTRSRLTHHFGAHHHFSIKSKPKEGTTITIDFPLGERHE
ncbi:MAG: sensor histidine kinase, partial [Candidatus Adiutrix sp.]